jgi:Uma2 family endonuclease
MPPDAAAQLMSLDEFLAWERGQAERHEFVDGAIRMMTGGSRDHSTIASNLWTALRDKLRGSGCRPFRGGAKVSANRSIRYPDLSVTCSPIDGRSDFVPVPVVVIEIIPRARRARIAGARSSTISPPRRSNNTRSSSRMSD